MKLLKKLDNMCVCSGSCEDSNSNFRVVEMLACGTAGWLPSGCVLASYVAVPVESVPVLNIQRYCKGESENLGLLGLRGLRKIPLRFYGGKGVTLYMSGFWGWIPGGHSNVA